MLILMLTLMLMLTLLMQVFRLGSVWVKDKSPVYGEPEQACNRNLSQVQVKDNNPDYDPL